MISMNSKKNDYEDRTSHSTYAAYCCVAHPAVRHIEMAAALDEPFQSAAEGCDASPLGWAALAEHCSQDHVPFVEQDARLDNWGRSDSEQSGAPRLAAFDIRATNSCPTFRYCLRSYPTFHCSPHEHPSEGVSVAL